MKNIEIYVTHNRKKILLPSWAVLLILRLKGCLHEISFRVKWNIFIYMSGKFLITAYMTQPEMKFIAGIISLQSFWQKWNFILGDKISCKHYPKWISRHVHPYQFVLKCSRNETLFEKNLFSRRFEVSCRVEFISSLLLTYSNNFQKY